VRGALATFLLDRALFAPGSLLQLFNGSRQLTAAPPVVEIGIRQSAVYF
jgi:hypothetical protein